VAPATKPHDGGGVWKNGLYERLFDGWDEDLSQDHGSPTSGAGSAPTKANDSGLGTATPGGADRSASPPKVKRQALAQTMRDAIERQGEQLRQEGIGAPVEVANDAIAPRRTSAQSLDSTPEEAFAASFGAANGKAAEPSILAGRSALDDNVALASRMRFQMINAMAMFDPSVGADIGAMSRAKPTTAPLLTTLPSYGQIS
jgi:hypothetical protein